MNKKQLTSQILSKVEHPFVSHNACDRAFWQLNVALDHALCSENMGFDHVRLYGVDLHKLTENELDDYCEAYLNVLAFLGL